MIATKTPHNEQSQAILDIFELHGTSHILNQSDLDRFFVTHEESSIDEAPNIEMNEPIEYGHVSRQKVFSPVLYSPQLYASPSFIADALEYADQPAKLNNDIHSNYQSQRDFKQRTLNNATSPLMINRPVAKSKTRYAYNDN